jgi:hypothetical protein
MKLFALLLCLITTSSVTAQVTVKASDIIKQINDGRSVEYTDATIEGVLDLTDLKNQDQQHQLFSFGPSDNTYESFVEVPVKFINCIFKNDVLAYYHIERQNETYVAHFGENVLFKNCVFKKASEFKYSDFKGSASFAGCTFNEDGNFKYAKFSSGPAFSNVKFESGADFKYTKFPEGTSFEKATFHGLANFKYTKFETPLNMKNVAFKGSEDFKYTKVDGRSFTAYLMAMDN